MLQCHCFYGNIKWTPGHQPKSRSIMSWLLISMKINVLINKCFLKSNKISQDLFNEVTQLHHAWLEDGGGKKEDEPVSVDVSPAQPPPAGSSVESPGTEGQPQCLRPGTHSLT